ncbi:MAG: hypothetical protein JXA20_13855 [Spirochaetes bacterium]|nr:hypothetical protein [Spirochaetota bacterium]
MKLKRLLALQVAYLLFGLAYNALSYWLLSTGGAALAPTQPLAGGAVMAAYGVCLIPGAMGHRILYRVFMAAAIPVLGYGGVIKHLMNFPGALHLYRSTAAWGAALAINCFGLALNLAAAAGRFKAEEPAR